MNKSKLSFFERLTGSIHIADEHADPMPPPGKRDHKPIPPHAKGEDPNAWMEEDNNDGELPVDMYQTAHEIIIRTMIAGVRPEDLQITISREMVTIHGKRAEQNESSGDDFFHKELYWGTFSRTIMLPQEVEAEEAEALEKHGLLTIRLPKINKEKISMLRVKSM